MSVGRRVLAESAPAVHLKAGSVAGRRLLTAARWQWLIVGLSLGMFYGAHLDAWAHVHLSAALETVFTPWHAVVYVSFAALIAVLAIPVVGRIVRRRALTDVIPRSYRIASVGLVVFLASGGMDLAWHLAFGIEVGVEALLSPTHLGLAIGAGMLWSGPISVAWRRARLSPSMTQLLPGLLSYAAIVGLAAFTTHFANPFVDAWPAYGYSERDPASWYVPGLGFSALAIQTAILVSAALVLLRRWPRPPFGTMTILFTVSSAGLAFLHDQPQLLLVPILVGAVADLLLKARPTRDVTQTRLFAVVLSVVMASAYFVVVGISHSIAWSAHLVFGAIVLAGAIGLLVSVAVFAPGRQPPSMEEAP